MTPEGSLEAGREEPRGRALLSQAGPLRRWIEAHPAVVLSLLAIVFLAVVIPVAFYKYNTYQIGFDLAQNEQAVWNTSQGRFFQTSAFGYTQYDFDDGPVLLQAVIAPIYALYPSAYTLLTLQGLAIGLAIIPLYYITKLRFKGPWVGFGLAVAYLLHPSVQHMALYQFEPRAFAIIPLLLAFYQLEKRNFRLFVLFFALAMLAKTEVSLVVVMLGIYALVTRKPPKFAVAPVLVGAGWLAIVMLVIIPQFAGGQMLAGAYGYGALGATPGEVLNALVTKPIFVLQYMFSPAKLQYLFDTFRAMGFVPLLQPQVLLLSLPIFLENLLSSRSVQVTLHYQYQAMIFPVLFASAAFGIAWLVRKVGWLSRHASLAAFCLTALVIIGSATMTVNPNNQVLNALKHPESQARIEAANQLIAMVPADAPVAASSGLGAHMGRRQELYFYPGGASYPAALVDKAHYLLVDVQGADENFLANLDKVKVEGKWTQVTQAQDYILFKK
jgi:uncharacterized membrane protein